MYIFLMGFKFKSYSQSSILDVFVVLGVFDVLAYADKDLVSGVFDVLDVFNLNARGLLIILNNPLTLWIFPVR